jgi:conjugative transfer signal peptidase TraF
MTAAPRKRLLAVIAAAVLLIAAAAFVAWPTWLVYNPSDSAPRGWYGKRTVQVLQPGMLVFGKLPAGAAQLAHARGYLPQHLPILKRIGAVGGQRVCVRAGVVRIDGRAVALARIHDGAGRPLLLWTGCRVLGRDEVFLFAPEQQASFDSRYFGPVGRNAILGQAVPLWTW